MSSPWHYIDGDPEKLIEALEEYTLEISEEIAKAQNKISRNARKKLAETAPYRDADEAKHYRDEWQIKREYTGHLADQKLTIHNKSKYRLTHLLEHGHAMRGGVGRVAPRVHIEPIEKEINEQFQEAVKKAIENHKKGD